ncbi:MAG: phosphonate ABC transporter ATP-binding protein, partial [Croceibacterium sp.]
MMDVQLQSLGKTWPDGTKALDQVGIVVPAGQFCVLLGHSGAGKSTLLRCVNGLEVPTSGSVSVGGWAVGPDTLPFLRRRIAMVHQDFRLVPRASVAANVMAGAAPDLPLWRVLTGLYPKALRQRACTMLQAVGLEPAQLGRRAGELSGGQQQRLGIARALMQAPSVLLADEPVASLDPVTSRKVLGLLRDLARDSGATVLCSLHQLDLAVDYADQVVALHRGRVIFDGPPAALDERQLAVIYPKSQPAMPALVDRKVAG